MKLLEARLLVLDLRVEADRAEQAGLHDQAVEKRAKADMLSNLCDQAEDTMAQILTAGSLL